MCTFVGRALLDASFRRGGELADDGEAEALFGFVHLFSGRGSRGMIMICETDLLLHGNAEDVFEGEVFAFVPAAVTAGGVFAAAPGMGLADLGVFATGLGVPKVADLGVLAADLGVLAVEDLGVLKVEAADLGVLAADLGVLAVEDFGVPKVEAADLGVFAADFGVFTVEDLGVPRVAGFVAFDLAT